MYLLQFCILQLNVSYVMMGLLILGHAFSVLAVPAADMVWIATLAALATAFMMYSLVYVCSATILLLCMTDCCVLHSVCPYKTALSYHLDLLRLAIVNLPNILCFNLPL